MWADSRHSPVQAVSGHGPVWADGGHSPVQADSRHDPVWAQEVATKAIKEKGPLLLTTWVLLKGHMGLTELRETVPG